MAERIQITDRLSLGAEEVELSFIRSSGPGGQNVNKVSSAVQLRFALRASASLPSAVKARAARLAGTRLTQAGEIVITASRHRTQTQNRADAIARLAELLAEAATPPKPRKKTRPTLASKRRRLEAKSQRGAVKSLRQRKPPVD